MSHFTVLVVGDDHDYQLAPFHEFECTGHTDEFVINVDKKAEALDEFSSENGRDETFSEWANGWYGLKTIHGDAAPDLEGDHKYGWVRMNGETVVEVIRRTNPNRKWDWYSVGGRWRGFFTLKPGASGQIGQASWANRDEPLANNVADRARKCDIDFEAMRDKEGQRAAEEWDAMDEARRAAGDTALNWMTWDEVRAEVTNVESTRYIYHAQPAVKAMKESELGKGFFFRSVDEFRCDRETYIQRARDKAIVTYAFVQDRKWAQKGEMGWWGISLNEMDQDEWNRWFNAQIDALPDDAILTLVDAHI